MDGAADDQAFVGVPINRVDSIDVVIEGFLNRKLFILLLLYDIDNDAFFICQPASHFRLGGRQA